MAQSANNTQAKANAPKLVLSPGKAIHFGKVIVGLISAPQTITLTNKSTTTAITITDIRVSPPFVQTGDTCGGSIAASGICTVSVAFKPTKHGRIRATKGLKFTDTAEQSPQHIMLEGKGIEGPTPSPAGESAVP